jgi:hypothetical protein
MSINAVESQASVNLLEKSEGRKMLPLEVKKSFKWRIGSIKSAPAKVFDIKAGTSVIYDSDKKQFIVNHKYPGDQNLFEVLKNNDCVVDKNNVIKSEFFRKVTVIPAYVMRGEDGVEYSPHGAMRKPSDKLVKTDKYTWETVDKDGTVRVGLGRQPAKSLDEAIKVAKELENKGMYYYMGVRKDKDMSKASFNKVTSQNENEESNEIVLPIESKDTLPGVNDVVVKIEEELIPGKIVIEFESGKAVTVDTTQPEPITESTPKELTDKELEAIEPAELEEPVVTAGAIVIADEERFNISFLERMVKALKTEINNNRRKGILKMINDTVRKIQRVQGSAEAIEGSSNPERIGPITVWPDGTIDFKCTSKMYKVTDADGKAETALKMGFVPLGDGNDYKLSKDEIDEIKKAIGSKSKTEITISAYSGEVRNKQEAIDLLNAVASFLKLQNADSKIRNLVAELWIALKKMPVKL